MTRSELNRLKQGILQRKDKAGDLEQLVSRLLPLLTAIKQFLPDEVLAILKKHSGEENDA